MQKVILALILALTVVGAKAQGINNVRINEVLVVNENNYLDDYGHRSSWIEIFNSGYQQVNVASCYLAVTDTLGRETKYLIPKGDPSTVMHAQTYLVFFCEGTDTKGTFYTNFFLDGAAKISLYTSGGDLVDQFLMDPHAQHADVSVGWMSPDGVEPPVVMELPKTTPNATNETLSAVSKGERFRERDRSGGVMAIIAMSVVFSALVLIFLILKCFGIFMVWFQGYRERKVAAGKSVITPKKLVVHQVEEEMAAIGLALKMYQEEQHILETTVITINRASRVYSPWSSKIHGIPALPNKK